MRILGGIFFVLLGGVLGWILSALCIEAWANVGPPPAPLFAFIVLVGGAVILGTFAYGIYTILDEIFTFK